MVHSAQSRQQARHDLIDRWDRDRQSSPDASRIILTHTNDEVRALNEAARVKMREAGDLGADVRLMIQRAEHSAAVERHFASGDRIMFLQNERGLGVKNGTLGTITEVDARSLSVRTDDGRSIDFDLKDYNRFDHGYAATIHKAQGMTVDRTHVLGTPGMDAHSSYVALSRHRGGLDLHYGQDDFATQDKLTRTLSRDRSKDMASDYDRADPEQAYAERRGITFRTRIMQIIRNRIPERLRKTVDRLLDGWRSPADAEPGTTTSTGPTRGGEEHAARPAPEVAIPDPGASGGARSLGPQSELSSDDREEALRHARTKALVRHARAVDANLTHGNADGLGTPAQMRELNDARRSFETVRPHGWRDVEAAYVKHPALVREASTGRLQRTIQALQHETELRTSPQLLADRFVDDWQKLKQTSQRQYQVGDMSGYKTTRQAMGDMAKSLQRDPQLESILASRKLELGIRFETGRSLGGELAFTHGIDLGRGRGLGI